MIKEYHGDSLITLRSDLAAELPLYFYWPKDFSMFLYSDSLVELLNDPRVFKNLTVSFEGISFLLQSGVVPPPNTIYEDVYVLGIGCKATVNAMNGKIFVDFEDSFPFLNENRHLGNEITPDEDLILQNLAEATVLRVDQSKPSFLFHSAGKDSNSIALALAEAGWQNKLTLISHKSKGKADESIISEKIAKKLGFKHHVLHEVDQLKAEHKLSINQYFVNTPFPCVDNVSLAYPLYAHQVPELKGANIIDGMGNDVFIGHIPSLREYKLQKKTKYTKYSRSIIKFLQSENLFHALGRSRSECTGLSGLSFSDAKKIFLNAKDVSSYWLSKDNNKDYLDFRASTRGVIIDQEVFIRKIRNFADSYSSNLVLPWANENVAMYFKEMPENYLFDRKTLKNKIILREILKKKIGLDSDALGKMGFSYDSKSIVLQNWSDILNEIHSCKLWNQKGLVEVVDRLKCTMQSEYKYAKFCGRLIYRIYLISAWFNRSKYLNG